MFNSWILEHLRRRLWFKKQRCFSTKRTGICSKIDPRGAKALTFTFKGNTLKCPDECVLRNALPSVCECLVSLEWHCELDSIPWFVCPQEWVTHENAELHRRSKARKWERFLHLVSERRMSNRWHTDAATISVPKNLSSSLYFYIWIRLYYNQKTMITVSSGIGSWPVGGVTTWQLIIFQ